MEQFPPKSSNGDYVIRDDVIGYPDTATDFSWPNEQSGITSFYKLWDRKFGESLARVSLRAFSWRWTENKFRFTYQKCKHIENALNFWFQILEITWIKPHSQNGFDPLPSSYTSKSNAIVSSRWSIRPNSAWGSIETTATGKTHPPLDENKLADQHRIL